MSDTSKDILSSGFVGIFWAVPYAPNVIELLTYKTMLSDAEDYGDCLTCPASHYNVWRAAQRGKPILEPLDDTIKSLIRVSEYEEWPRGRVIFDRSKGQFLIYADRQTFPYADRLRERFNLPETTMLHTDPHYRLAKKLF
nr:hypothetical protein [uncultured Acidocella sp.]